MAEQKEKKGKKTVLTKVLGFVAWLTGIIVSLAVAFGMINEVLKITGIPTSITILFGWIVVITTLISVILAIINLFN